MKLWDLKKNQSAFFGSLSSSIEDKLVARLIEMGFEQGQEVRCVRRSPFRGPVIVSLGGTILALEQSIAELISLSQNNTNTL
ncbi:MAG: FeoA family protein [Pseudomonadota bacterium]